MRPKKGNTTDMRLRIYPELKEDIFARAKEQGISVNDWLVHKIEIENYLQNAGMNIPDIDIDVDAELERIRLPVQLKILVNEHPEYKQWALRLIYTTMCCVQSISKWECVEEKHTIKSE